MGSWSYFILGNDDIYDYLSSFIVTCASNLTEKEYEDFGKFENFQDLPLLDRKYVIDKNLGNLVALVKEDPRMDGFLALGVIFDLKWEKMQERLLKVIGLAVLRRRG